MILAETIILSITNLTKISKRVKRWQLYLEKKTRKNIHSASSKLSLEFENVSKAEKTWNGK